MTSWVPLRFEVSLGRHSGAPAITLAAPGRMLHWILVTSLHPTPPHPTWADAALDVCNEPQPTPHHTTPPRHATPAAGPGVDAPERQQGAVAAHPRRRVGRGVLQVLQGAGQGGLVLLFSFLSPFFYAEKGCWGWVGACKEVLQVLQGAGQGG